MKLDHLTYRLQRGTPKISKIINNNNILERIRKKEVGTNLILAHFLLANNKNVIKLRQLGLPNLHHERKAVNIHCSNQPEPALQNALPTAALLKA